MKINNLPEYAKDCKYIVVRLVDNEVWFWGAYEDLAKAYQSASEINGIVVLKEKNPFINKPCISGGVCEHDKLQLLDRIKSDIEQKQNDYMDSKDYDNGVRFGLMLAYKTINKYKKEIEVK